MEKPPQEEEEITSRQAFLRLFRYHWRGFVLILTPLVLMPLLFQKPLKEFNFLYISLVMYVWYLTNAMPLYITAALPTFAYPVFSVIGTKQTISAYFAQALLLWIGGSLTGLALISSNLAPRLVLRMLISFGGGTKGLLFGFMLSAALLSMAAPGVCVVSMLMPILDSILKEQAEGNMLKLTKNEAVAVGDPPVPSTYVAVFYLAIAYSSTIGSVASLYGSGANIVLKGNYEHIFKFEEMRQINFFSIFANSMPFVVVLLVATFVYLYYGFIKKDGFNLNQDASARAITVMQTKLNQIGPFTLKEAKVLVVFILFAGFSITNKFSFWEGWSQAFIKRVETSAIAMMAVVLLFIFPQHDRWTYYFICRNPDTGKEIPSVLLGKFLHKEMPWGQMLLIGCGIAMALTWELCKFGTLFRHFLYPTSKIPEAALLLIFVLLTSAHATILISPGVASFALPIATSVAMMYALNPILLAMPVAMASNISFMFPSAGSTNEVVHKFANIRRRQFAKIGIGPTVFAIILCFITGLFWTGIVLRDINQAHVLPTMPVRVVVIQKPPAAAGAAPGVAPGAAAGAAPGAAAGA